MAEPTRVEMIRACINAALAPNELDIVDESHLHAGHTGHGGAGHFRVRIVSDKFAGHAPLARHRMVFAAVDKLMQTEIHALSIDAVAPGEQE